jgi:hypothetical protein
MSIKMILGGYTFTHNPHRTSDLLKPEMPNALLITYDSFAYFSWPATIVGKIVTLNWDLMSVEQYEALYTKYIADAIIVFDPRQDVTLQFNVIIKAIKGLYFLNMADNNTYRKDVSLELIITSAV